MKLQAVNEKEMKESQVPKLEKLEELEEYIQSCIDIVNDHDEKNEEEVGDAYGRCVYAMSLASVATFNHVAKALGVTGFQADAADLDIISRTRNINGPFMIITFEDLLYPNKFDPQAKIQEVINSPDTRNWMVKELLKNINSNNKNVHPDVMKHWKKMLSQLVPPQAPTPNPARKKAKKNGK
jgi:hypothetical protein